MPVVEQSTDDVLQSIKHLVFQHCNTESQTHYLLLASLNTYPS